MDAALVPGAERVIAVIWIALAYLLSIWMLTFPALCARLLQAKTEKEFAGMVYIWEALPALILMSPALFLGYIVLWITEHFLKALVIAGQASWRAWLAIGRPAAALSVYIVTKLTQEIP
jgi:hypothetical protein